MGIINYIQHLGGTAPLKFGMTKNVQNSAQFRTTSDFDREYLKNRSIYRNKETIFTEGVGQNKCGELWFTNKKVIDADVDLPKIDCARNFEQLQSSVANISGTDQDINNRKQTDRLPSFPC